MFTSLVILVTSPLGGKLFGMASFGIASAFLKMHLKKQEQHMMALIVDQVLYLVTGWITADIVLSAAEQIYYIVANF